MLTVISRYEEEPEHVDRYLAKNRVQHDDQRGVIRDWTHLCIAAAGYLTKPEAVDTGSCSSQFRYSPFTHRLCGAKDAAAKLGTCCMETRRSIVGLNTSGNYAARQSRI